MTTSIITTFDDGLDNWTMNGDVAEFQWESSGGDPGGYAYWVDAATGQDSYYVAPSQYAGEQSAYYGGTISYDIYDTGNDYSGVPDIELTGDGLTLVYVAGQPNTTWTDFSASLTAGSGWLVGAHDTSVAGDPAATEAQMQEVLANLTSVEIRAEYVDGAEDGGLDNVVMTSSATNAWDLFDSASKSNFLGAFSTFSAALATSHAGDDIVFANGGSGGVHLGTVVVNTNDLTIEADTSVTGTFRLSAHVTTFALGGTGNLNMTSLAAAAALTGNSGANVIHADGGGDTINAGAGDDQVFLTSTPDLVDGGAGTNVVHIVSGEVALNDTNIADIARFYVQTGATLDFSGGSVARTIISQSAASSAATIIGSQGADQIHAGAGADSITGGAGADKIFAGSGADTFHYDAAGFGHDTIYHAILAKDTFDLAALGSSLANLHFTATGTGGVDTRITGSGDTNTGDSILLINITPSQAQANGHFTF